MVGGLLQLKEKGSQDIYLTGNPQITFFKIIYRRHTNFSIESILQIWENKVSDNQLSTRCVIGRKGDLISKMYIQDRIYNSSHTIENGKNLQKNHGYDMINNVNIQIGSQIIDEHTNNWLETYAELTQKNEYGFLSDGGDAMCQGIADGGECTKFQALTFAGGVNGISSDSWRQKFRDIETETDYNNYYNANPIGYIYVPLQFWFCRNIGLSLPLIALQYNEVVINIDFKNILNNPELYIDYIFLDTDERRRFAQISHEYLIEQVQVKVSSPGQTHNLKFNNPVKELIWVSTPSDNVSSANYGTALIGDWKLQINGYDRFSYRDISYFTKQQIYDYHTGYGGITVKNSIAVYSFSLYPEDFQPSGTMNFSNIQHCYLLCRRRPEDDPDKIISQSIIVYVVNYNILRILSGQGSLAYSN